ncbi:trafficking kinesin-binding protein 1-like isoform X2 [Tachypleus tridentatus]|uniref:trafficking kinesin-binding protein 1-like isoform X2 n=1 Tax=Tachypleus tridentatus TaxID=6853 RepID=UPI003FD57C26
MLEYKDTCSQNVLELNTLQRTRVQDVKPCADQCLEEGELATERQRGFRSFCHVGTLTDLCNDVDIPEVELQSLMREDTPRYNLRADTITEFSGYRNNDWIQTPVLPVDIELNLSPGFLSELFVYFLSCGNRLSQMTKTYNDVESLRTLLEEKEKDLELAAQIGQSLLEQNKQLTRRNECLEQELTSANETINQLKRDLATKVSLLQVYTQDLDASSEVTTPTDQAGFDWVFLQKKIQELEEKNLQLRSEVNLQEASIEEEEKKEMEILHEFAKELTDARKQITTLQEEQDKKSDDFFRQQEEVTRLLSQVVELQHQVRSLIADNEDLQESLQASKEDQTALLNERNELKDKYAELSTAFQEVQEENKKVHRTSLPSAKQWNYNMYNPYVNPDSLASELESSFGRDSEGYASDELLSHSKRVFQTVHYAGKPKSSRQRRNTGYRYEDGTPQRERTRSSLSLSHLPSSSSCFNDSFVSDCESLYAESCHTDDDESQYSSLGRPGAPGSSDFEAALSRLGIQRDSSVLPCLNQATRFDTTEDLSESNHNWLRDKEMLHRLSILAGQNNHHYHMPEKLQIIKPLEGSQTLHHWQRLATPHLGGIFETRPGIQIKGEVHLPELEPDTFTLSDLEEDEACCQSGMNFVQTSTTYTYTNSTVIHPLNQNHIMSSLPTIQDVVSEVPKSLEVDPLSHIEAENLSSLTKSKTAPDLNKLLQDQKIYAILPSLESSTSKEVAPPGICNSSGTPGLLRPVLFPTLMTYNTGKYHLSTNWNFVRRTATPTTVIHTTETTTTPVIKNTIFPVLSPIDLMEQLNLVRSTKQNCVRGMPRFNIPRYFSQYGLSTVSDDSPLTLTNKQKAVDNIATHVPSNLDNEDDQTKEVNPNQQDKNDTVPFSELRTPVSGNTYPFYSNRILPIHYLGIGFSQLVPRNILCALRKGGYSASKQSVRPTGISNKC